MALGNSPLGASVFVLTAAITFATYAKTTSHSIAGGDSGELVAEGCQLGTSHPPGYPLYTIIVYLVTTLGKQWFPLLSPAYLVNVTSCIFGSISSGLISLVVFQVTNENEDRRTPTTRDQVYVTSISRCSAALSVGLMCSFSPLMWQYNTSAEVFALHNLFVSLIMYVMVIYSFRPDSTFITAVGSFLCGLALTNQHTSILLVLPVAAWVFYNSSLLKKPKLLLMSSISFIGGIGLYALLPLLAISYPHAGSWGDVTTLSGFIHHFLRRDYGTLRLYSGSDASSECMIERTLSWAMDFASDQLGRWSLLVLVPLLGFISGMRLCSNRERSGKSTKKKRGSRNEQVGNEPSSTVWNMILFALIFYLAAFHSLSNLPLSNPLLYGIHQRFWMHPNILCFMLIGIATHNSTIAVSTSPTRTLVLAIMILLMPYAAYRQNYSINDQSTNNYFNKYAMSILETLPANSLVLSNYDQQWTSIRYMQECEGVRSDITSINLSMMTFEWWQTKHSLYDEKVVFPGTHYTKGNTLPWLNGGFTFSEFIEANEERFGSNIFIGGRLNFEDPSFNEKYREEPFGLLRRISRNSTFDSVESYRSETSQVWRNVAKHLSPDLPCEKKYPASTWEWTIGREFFDHLVSRSTFLLDLALKENERSTHNIESSGTLPSIVEAAAWLELARSWDEHAVQQSAMRKNLGLAYMNMVRSKESSSFPHVEDIFAFSGNWTWADKVGSDFDGHMQHRQNWWTEFDGDWKKWATIRWREEWEAFLGLESSKADPSYSQIKNIYDAVINSSRAKSGSN